MRLPLLVVTTALFVVPSPASAAIFDVTKTDDDVTCTPGNCSLRGAIQAANATPEADTINVPAGRHLLTIAGDEDAGAEGDLDINGSVTIAGAGAESTIVDAGNEEDVSIEDRVFDVQPGGGPPDEVTIRDLTVTGGSQFEGGGVRNGAALTLQRVEVTGNDAFSGGGVAQNSDETLLRILDSWVTDNIGTQGAGVAQNAGTTDTTEDIGVQIDRTLIAGNQAVPGGEGDPDGAGIGINNSGDVDVRNSTITENVVIGLRDDASGGGVYVNNGSLFLTNTTVHDNTAVNGYGGGIANTDGHISLLNATVTDNEVGESGPPERRSLDFGARATDPGDAGLPGGNVDSFGRSNTFKNTIVAGGSPQNCRGRFDTPFTSSGHNLESADTCSFDAASDLTGSDPLLGPLADNGGPTDTRALQSGSPAIDSADNAACPEADQRGVARPQPAGGTCDRGAYERPGLDLAITKLASASSVRAGEQVRFTLAVANAGPADASGVTVTDSLPDGLQFVSAQPSQGSCSGTSTVSCSLGTVAAGQSVDVVINATVTRAGEFTNTATVGHDGTYPESTTANNSASAKVTGTETPVTPDPEPGPQPCVDTVAPITDLTQRNVRVRRGRVHLSGTTRDPDPCASGVNRVLVSLARVKGRHLVNCRFLKSKTRYALTKAPGMNCQDPVLFLAKGGVTQGTASARYSFIFFVDLPDGIYRAQARAFDNAGNKERPTRGRNIRKFFVR